MRIPKIYLDTSVISHLKQDDAPDKTNDTLLLWEDIKQGDYKVIISELTFSELSDCSSEKQSILARYIDMIKYIDLEITSEAETLANDYISHKVLTAKSYDDCLHLALATVSNCDIVASWNFKHMVRYKTIEGVRNTNALNGYYKNLDIVQPTILIRRED